MSDQEPSGGGETSPCNLYECIKRIFQCRNKVVLSKNEPSEEDVRKAHNGYQEKIGLNNAAFEDDPETKDPPKTGI